MAELQGLTFLFGGLLGAGGVGNDSLTLSGIAAGTPVCGQPALTQNHSLTASGLATTAPVCGTTALTQNHSLAPSGLATGSPVVGTTSLTQNHSLAASGLVAGSPVLQGAALTQNHSLGAASVAAGTPAVGQSTLTQNHSFGSTGLTAGAAVLGVTVLIQNHTFSLNNLIFGTPVLGSPNLSVIQPNIEGNWWFYWYKPKGLKMKKNQPGQSITLLAIDTLTGTPKTNDAANLTAYVSKDDGTVTTLADTTALQLNATNAKGLYSWSLTQAETNGDKLVFSGKSTTLGVELVPEVVYPTQSAVGNGGVSYTVTVTDGSFPLDGVAVWVTTDQSGNNSIAGPVYTNVMGQAVFTLEPGSYYAFCQRSGVNFQNPQLITVA
jgi:hypothetical protein